MKDRKREVEELMTGPSCKAMCSWSVRPTQGMTEICDWIERGGILMTDWLSLTGFRQLLSVRLVVVCQAKQF